MEASGTLVIDKWATGPATFFQNGDINSGLPFFQTVGGYNPLVKPGLLTWAQAVEQIDAAGSVITDLIMAGKTRVENGVTYVYAIGHTARLYKIQVNDPNTFNPDYDNPVLLATLSTNSPTFTRGGFIEFFGATEKIYIGHDKGVTSINFDGSGEAFVGNLGSWTQTVPRPFGLFVGNLCVGNGSNIALVDSTATVSTYAKFSPGFPTNSQVRDIDVTVEGTYLEVVVSTIALSDQTSSTQDTTSDAPGIGYVFRWNGTDAGYTSYTTYPSAALSANILFQGYQYVFGSDVGGLTVFNPSERIVTIPETPSLNPNAISSFGNSLLWMAPLSFGGFLEADLYMWGPYDWQVGRPIYLQDIAFFNASGTETDVIRVPLLLQVSNFGTGASSNGYVDNIFGTSKYYISAMETSGTPTTKYKLYRWKFPLTTISTADSPVTNSIYQTQTQLFSKKVRIAEVRIYGEPWVTGNSFQMDILGSSGLQDGAPVPITGASKLFTVGDGLTVGDDFAYWQPECAPTFSIGVALYNFGSTNHTIQKVEIDWVIAGK